MKSLNYRWILVIIWMGLIFFLSHQDGTTASNASSGFIDTVVTYATAITPLLGVIAETILVDFPFDVLVHFTLYLVLGVLIIHAYSIKEIDRDIIIRAYIFCFLYAITDEFHQLFIPGRTFQVFDIFIDSVGSITGIMLYIGIGIVIKKRNQKKSKHSQI